AVAVSRPLALRNRVSPVSRSSPFRLFLTAAIEMPSLSAASDMLRLRIMAREISKWRAVTAGERMGGAAGYNDSVIPGPKAVGPLIDGDGLERVNQKLSLLCLRLQAG